MRKLAVTAVTAACIFSAGCATTPDVTMNYYLPKSTLTLKAIRTVGCNSNGLFHIVSFDPKTTFTRDDSTEAETIRFKALSGTFVNNDLSVSLTDDGRLKGINASTTGRGEDIIKVAAQIAAAFIPLPAPGPVGFVERQKTPTELACEAVQTYGKDGMLTMNYSGTFQFSSTDKPELALVPERPNHHLVIDRALPRLCASVTEVDKDNPPVQLADGTTESAAMNIYLRQPARVSMEVRENALSCGTPVAAAPVWSATLLVPQLGDRYNLPIPKGALFGKQSFVLAVSESGTITTLQYGREAGAPGLLGAANALLGATNTTAEQAAALKAEADLIAQQQRVLRCRMDPSTCT